MYEQVINKRHAELIGVEKVIYGKMQEVTNPVTNKTTIVGDGKTVFDIKQERGSHFLVRLRRD